MKLKIGAILQWILAGFIFLLSLSAFLNMGFVSGILFLALGVLVSPLRKKVLTLLPDKFQNRIVAIVAGIVLTIGSFVAFPSTTTTEVADTGSEESIVEKSINVGENVETEEAASVEEESSNILDLSFSTKQDIELVEGKDLSTSYVKAKVKDKDSFSESDVIFVSADPEIATIEFAKTALSNYLYFKITGVSVGETEIYAVSNDGRVESEHKKVTVKADEEKLAKEKEEAEKAEAEKKAVEKAEELVEEEQLAKEKNETEDQSSNGPEENNVVAEAPDVETATDQSSATNDAAAQPQSTDGSQNNENAGGSDGGGENFDTYNIPEQQNTEATYVLNTNTKKFHYPSCSSVKKIKPENYATSSASRDELIAQGYDPCGNCHP